VVAGPDHHVLCGRDEGDRGLSGIRVRDPDGERDVVGGSSEHHRERPKQVHHKLGVSILVCWRRNCVREAACHDGATYCRRWSAATAWDVSPELSRHRCRFVVGLGIPALLRELRTRRNERQRGRSHTGAITRWSHCSTWGGGPPVGRGVVMNVVQ
jgi:hypothetical protein